MATLHDLVQAYQRAKDAIPAAERAAAERVAEAKRRRAAAREALAEGIVASYRAGMTQTEIVQETGFTREHIRRILRAAGVQAGE